MVQVHSSGLIPIEQGVGWRIAQHLGCGGWGGEGGQHKVPWVSQDRPVLKQQAMPVPAEIVPVYTMGMATQSAVRCAGNAVECSQQIGVECSGVRPT
jgi:hypothetical protein